MSVLPIDTYDELRDLAGTEATITLPDAVAVTVRQDDGYEFQLTPEEIRQFVTTGEVELLRDEEPIAT